MGKKYIIELEDKPFHKGNGDFLYRVKGFNSLVFDMNGVGKLTPYTKPDLEQVRKEAYEQGYYIGYSKYLNRSYEDGLSDAWEAARKIGCPRTHSGFGIEINNEIFGACDSAYILAEFSAFEAIEKIRAYEQKQKEIKVGDEVEWNGDRYVVTYIDVDEAYVDVIDCSCGSVCDRLAIKSITKTGRHFPEIAAVLEKMRGE